MLERLDSDIRNAEDGFTVIEVLVAAFIAVSVIAGFVYFFTTANHQASLASIRSRQSTVAKAVWESLNSSGSWTTACTKTGVACTVPPAIYMDAIKPLDVETGDLIIAATATGRDIVADNAGGRDRNGVAPDIYALRVVVSHNTPSHRKSRDVVLSGSFDPTKAGKAGSLLLKLCQMTPQVDERIHITDCSVHPAKYEIEEPLGTSEESGEMSSWDALMEYPGSEAMRFVYVVTPAPGLQVRVIGSDRASGWTSVSSSGAVEFFDLPPGAYRYEVRGHRQRDLSTWAEGSTPHGGTVAVSAGTQARAIAMLRVERKRVPIDIAESVTASAAKYKNRWVRLMPLPAARMNSGRVDWMDEDDAMAQGWAKLGTIDDHSYLATQPGLYAVEIWTQRPPGWIELAPLYMAADDSDPVEYEGDFIWISPSGKPHYNLPRGDDRLTMNLDGLSPLGGEGGA